MYLNNKISLTLLLLTLSGCSSVHKFRVPTLCDPPPTPTIQTPENELENKIQLDQEVALLTYYQELSEMGRIEVDLCKESGGPYKGIIEIEDQGNTYPVIIHIYENYEIKTTPKRYHVQITTEIETLETNLAYFAFNNHTGKILHLFDSEIVEQKYDDGIQNITNRTQIDMSSEYNMNIVFHPTKKVIIDTRLNKEYSVQQ